MAEFVIHVGSSSARGHRPNNEDRFVVDPDQHLYLVADGMRGHRTRRRKLERLDAVAPSFTAYAVRSLRAQ